MLRKAAEMVLADVDEPCWGIAHSLAEHVEMLVQASGLHPACFGNEVFYFDPARVAIMGDSTPACCAACGGFGGGHAPWCIHYAERASEPPSATPAHYFGCCPVCHGEPVHLFVGFDDWFACEKHMIAWWVGSGLFSGWQDLEPEVQERNSAFIRSCEQLGEPPTCTCSEHGQDAAPAQDDDEVCELLAWLELPADFPEPPMIIT